MAAYFVGLYSQGLLYGGPAVLLWGWVFTGCMTILVGLAMSELSSAFPVSGGLYFWSFMLAGKYGPLTSWVVGWVNLLGQASIHCLRRALQLLVTCILRGCLIAQVAFVAGNTYTSVQVIAAMLFLSTQTSPGGGYYPSNSTVC